MVSVLSPKEVTGANGPYKVDIPASENKMADITIIRFGSETIQKVKAFTWREWLRPLFVMMYLLLSMVIMYFLGWRLVSEGLDLKSVGWIVIGFFSLIAVGFSIYSILCHVIHFTKPNQQRFVVRILLMVPVYAINSGLALKFTKSAIYLDSIREIYEAFVVYSFMFYLMHYLYDNYDIDTHLAHKPRLKSPRPYCCLKPGPNEKLIYRCRNGVLNFVIIGPLCTFAAIVTNLLGVYDEGNFEIAGIWFWLTLVRLLSQVWGMYCLVLFYNATADEIRPLNPVPKFTCVQLAIFGSFVQEVLVTLLVNLIADDDKQVYAKALQNFLICVEMGLLSVVHLYTFSHKPYKGKGEPYNFVTACCKTLDFRDFRDDLVIHSGRLRKQIRDRGKEQDDEEYILKPGDQFMDDLTIQGTTIKRQHILSNSDDDSSSTESSDEDVSSHPQNASEQGPPSISIVEVYSGDNISKVEVYAGNNKDDDRDIEQALSHDEEDELHRQLKGFQNIWEDHVKIHDVISAIPVLQAQNTNPEFFVETDACEKMKSGVFGESWVTFDSHETLSKDDVDFGFSSRVDNVKVDQESEDLDIHPTVLFAKQIIDDRNRLSSLQISDFVYPSNSNSDKVNNLDNEWPIKYNNLVLTQTLPSNPSAIVSELSSVTDHVTSEILKTCHNVENLVGSITGGDNLNSVGLSHAHASVTLDDNNPINMQHSKLVNPNIISLGTETHGNVKESSHINSETLSPLALLVGKSAKYHL